MRTRSGTHGDGFEDGPGPPADVLREEAQRALTALREIVNRPPRIVILGEGNSGKTTLANRLVGGDLLPASLVGNARYSTLIRFSETVEASVVMRDGHRRPLDADACLLQPYDIAYLDVGLPDPRLRRYEVLDACHRADPLDLLAIARPGTLQIPVWCTVATQAWKHSEQRAWTAMPRSIRRRGLLAVTCCDRIVEGDDRRKLLRRLGMETNEDFAAIALAPQPWVGSTSAEDIILAHAARLVARRRTVAGRLSRRIMRLGNALGGGKFPLISAV